MSKHIGHDDECGYRFRIVGIDATNQTVSIQYESTAWDTGRGQTESLLCTEFLERLAAGRFEIRPAA